MKPTALMFVLLACSAALSADKEKPERPDAKFLAAVDKAIAAAQEKAVPTPKLLKLAKVLIKKGRLIRANEVAALIARKKTDADQATAKKINTAVAQCKSIVGSWEFNNSVFHFSPDGKIKGGSIRYGRWRELSPGKYSMVTAGHQRQLEPLGLNCVGTYTNAAKNKDLAGKPYPGKRVK